MPHNFQTMMDFHRDWARIIKFNIESQGYKIKNGTPDELMCLQYFNIQKRSFLPIPREVLFSTDFRCPLHLQNGLNVIKEKINRGVSIKPHLSKKIMKLEYNDDLINDWGVYHLHLGTSLDKDGFVERTGPLLFVRVDFYKAYFINVMPHGSWTNMEIVKTLHKNWPESISSYRLHIDRTEVEITQNIRKKLRGKVNTLIQMDDGTAYAPMGGGTTTAGVSAEVVRLNHYCFNQLKLYELWLNDNILILRKEIKELQTNKGPLFIFSLEVFDNIAYAREIVSQVLIKLGPVLPERMVM